MWPLKSVLLQCGPPRNRAVPCGWKYSTHRRFNVAPPGTQGGEHGVGTPIISPDPASLRCALLVVSCQASMWPARNRAGNQRSIAHSDNMLHRHFNVGTLFRSCGAMLQCGPPLEPSGTRRCLVVEILHTSSLQCGPPWTRRETAMIVPPRVGREPQCSHYRRPFGTRRETPPRCLRRGPARPGGKLLEKHRSRLR